MGETSNFNVCALIPDPEIRQAVHEILRNYAGSVVYANEDRGRNGTVLVFGANDVSLSAVDECFQDLLSLVADGVEEWSCSVCRGTELIPGTDETCLRCAGQGHYTLVVPDFPFEVFNEPVYEWMGTIRIHAPGLPDFSADCDADGQVRPASERLLDLVEKATDLDRLRSDIAALTGRQHKSALRDQEDR